MNISKIFEDTFSSIGDWAESAGPKLLAGLVILIVGWLVSKLVQVGLVRTLRLVKLDVLSEKTGFDEFLRRGNIQSGSVVVIGKVIYWVMLLLTLLVSVSAMGLTEAQGMVGQVVAIVPGVVLAIIILILGLGFSQFLSDVVQTASANAEMGQARLLGNVTRYTINVFVIVLALNQLKLELGPLTDAFLLLFGAVCFAFALAFGLGCRDLAKDIAEGFWNRERQAADAMASDETEAAADAGAEA